MKKPVILTMIILLVAIITAAQAEVVADVSGCLGKNYIVQVNSVTVAEPDLRAGGLPAYEVDDRIKDCGCSPGCDKPIKSKPARAREGLVIILNMQFDTGKSIVKEKYYDDIKKVADFLNAFTDKNAVIEGYTDSLGNEDYNRILSENRAKSVRQMLIDKYGIDGSRISAVGYGKDNPLASNDTAAGRQKNRRIETVIDAARAK
jgi:outer membrane protein OmpA-like peptidoglycan-associated protein